MMRKILFVCCLSFCLQVNAAQLSIISPTSLNRLMQDIGKIMVQRFPLLFANRPLTHVEKIQMGHDIVQLNNLFLRAKPYIDKKSITYQISLQFALEHLTHASNAFAENDFDYVKQRLHHLRSICVSCHTQDTKLRTLFADTSREHFDNDYSFAEFNYTTRNYEVAMIYYDKHLLSERPKSELEIIQPLQRLITIYTQLFNDPAKGAKKLYKYVTLAHHSATTKAYLEASIAGLKILAADGVSGASHIDFKTLEHYVDRYLGRFDLTPIVIYSTPQEEVSRVWLRGLLFHYLNANPAQQDIPKILYWLSICDRAIGYDFDFSLADYYLKACVLKFSSHPFAKHCYDEYKAYITAFYTRPTETIFVPIEIHRELEMLRLAIENK